jgi:membrane-bound ClpP family serine protease
MRTATGLVLIAIGAIFTFAVTAHPSFLNLQIVGVVLMATGIAGLFLRKPTQGWLRRRTTLRRGAGGPVVGNVDEKRYPPYVMLNPAADTEQAESNGHQPGDLTAGETVEPEPRDETAPVPDLPAEEDGDPAAPQAAEVVEEYIQE